MRVLFHPTSRDARGRLGLGVDLDYGPGRDPMSIHIDVPREFESHAKSWLMGWAKKAHQYVGMSAALAPGARARVGLPISPSFAGTLYGGYAGTHYGAAYGARSRPAPRVAGAQAARAFQAIRQGRGGNILSRITQGVAAGDRQAIAAAEKLEEAAKASDIARKIRAGDPNAAAFKQALDAQGDDDAQEASAMIDSCLARGAAQAPAKSCGCETNEELLDDLLADQWDVDPAEMLSATFSPAELAGVFVKNAGTEMADEMLTEYSGSSFNEVDNLLHAARYEGLRRRVLSQSW